MNNSTKIQIDEIEITAPAANVTVDGKPVEDKNHGAPAGYRLYTTKIANHPFNGDWWFEVGYWKPAGDVFRGFWVAETRADQTPRKFTNKTRARNLARKLNAAWKNA